MKGMHVQNFKKNVGKDLFETQEREPKKSRLKPFVLNEIPFDSTVNNF
jgi:hypothetical protein